MYTPEMSKFSLTSGDLSHSPSLPVNTHKWAWLLCS